MVPDAPGHMHQRTLNAQCCRGDVDQPLTGRHLVSDPRHRGKVATASPRVAGGCGVPLDLLMILVLGVLTGLSLAYVAGLGRV